VTDAVDTVPDDLEDTIRAVRDLNKSITDLATIINPQCAEILALVKENSYKCCKKNRSISRAAKL